MNTVDSLDNLLDLLNDGDETAAEQVFLAYEPYLRMVVRRRLSVSRRPAAAEIRAWRK